MRSRFAMTCFSIFTPPEFVMILTSKIKQLLSSPKYLGEELKEGFIISKVGSLAHHFLSVTAFEV